MIFFATGDGTIIKTLPSPVYQGSENASEIYLIAPFSPNLKVTVRFRLPNGIWTTPTLMDNGIDGNQMTAQGTLASPDGAIVDKETGKQYAVWTKPISGEVTQYYGTVTAQFFFYAAQGGVVTSTSAANFPVGRGVPAVLPDAPTEDVYEAILSNLSALQEQLDNGTYTARSIYAWNSSYTYGAGEIVYYPDQGEYGVFLKSLTAGNKTEPYTDGVLNSEKWEEVVDFNTLNSLYSLRDDLNEAIQNADEITQRAEDAEQSANSSAQSAASSAAESEASAKRVEDAAVYLESIRDGIEAVPKSVADETGKNIAEQFSDINEKIPSAASAENQLADKAFVNSSINNSAAFYITFNANGDAFPTRADLLNATTFYSGGKERVPTQNDYAIVLADENQPQGVDGKYPTTRYSYQGGTYPDGQWNFQYVVNNTSLTQEQVDAINSGITKDLVSNIFPPNTSVPLMDGVSSAGNSNNYARGDHRHPTDTTRASTAVATQTSNGLMSSADKIKLDGIGGSAVTGVKGKAETTYRTGNVNLTPANIGAVNKSGDTMDGALNLANNTPNAVGDDVEIGDFNIAGAIGIRGKNGETKISLLKQGASWNPQEDRGDISYNGTTLHMSKSLTIDASGGSVNEGVRINSGSGWSVISLGADRGTVSGADTAKGMIIARPVDSQYLIIAGHGNESNDKQRVRIEKTGEIYEQGERVYSPNNPPMAQGYNPNGKTDASNQTDTVRSYHFDNIDSPHMWYRKWASQWKECGGRFDFTPSTDGTYTVNFPLTYRANEPPMVIATCGNWYNSTYACQMGIINISNTSFTFRMSGKTIARIYWYCCGF